MCYDFYSCPFEPDTCTPPCGEQEECQDCEWAKNIKAKNKSVLIKVTVSRIFLTIFPLYATMT